MLLKVWTHWPELCDGCWELVHHVVVVIGGSVRMSWTKDNERGLEAMNESDVIGWVGNQVFLYPKAFLVIHGGTVCTS